MELTLTSKHELLGGGYFIGVDNENLSEQLIINIEPEELLDKWAYIEFQVNEGDKYNTQRLDIVDRQIIYDLPNGLLEKGYINIQVIFRDETNYLWKSFKKKFHIGDAINACQNLPEEYPDFITEAQKLLDEVSIDAAKIDEVIETEAARVEAENIRVENENTRIVNENNRSNAEQTRSVAETERISNEETRQSNELARVTAETERKTKFNTWENTLGVLDNLSNALKNTASGEVIRVDDVSPVEHNVKIEVLSNNYFIVPTEQTINGVTLTIDENGVIHLNGTCTIDGYFQESVVLPKNGMYYFADFATGNFPSNSSVRTQIYDDVNVVSLPILNNASLNAIVGKEFKNTKVWCRIRVTNGFTYNDCTLKPTLCYGKEPIEYTPYVDPTSVTVTRCGKNLADLSKALKDDVFVNNGDGSYTLTKVGSGGQRFSMPMPMHIKARSSMLFTFDIIESTITQQENNAISINFTHSDGTESTSAVKNGTILNVSKDLVQIIIFIQASESDGTYITFKDFQVEIGNTSSDYEAYKGITYIPNADGTLTIASTAPTMTLLTDKSGVNIDLEYNQDINKVIKSLQDKINALTK